MKLIYTERRSHSRLWVALAIVALATAALLYNNKTSSHAHAGAATLQNDSTTSVLSTPRSATYANAAFIVPDATTRSGPDLAPRLARTGP